MPIAFKSVSAVLQTGDDSGTGKVVNFAAGVVEGDFLLAYILTTNSGGGNPSATFPTLPAGWNALFDIEMTLGGLATGVGLFVATRFAPAGGLSSETFTASFSTGHQAFGLAYTGVDPTTPIDASAAGIPNLDPIADNTAPTVVTVTNDCLVLSFLSRDDDDALPTAPGTTRFAEILPTIAANGAASMCVDDPLVTAGTSATVVFSFASEESSSATVALRPAPSPTITDAVTIAGGNSYALSEETITLNGLAFSATGNSVLWSKTLDFSVSQVQTIQSESTTSISVVANHGAIGEGRGYFRVTDAGAINSNAFRLPIVDLAPAFKIITIRSTVNTVVGNQSFTDAAVNFTPAAAMAMMSQNLVDGFIPDASWGIGFAVSPTDTAAGSTSSLDNIAGGPTVGRLQFGNTAPGNNNDFIILLNGTTIIATAELVSFDAGGLTVNWTLALPRLF